MAVKASGSVTVASITDVASTTRWYLLQSSTLSAPAKPTASPPGGSWAATEPTYTEGSTNSLYTCDLTTFSDGTLAYSSVSLSTSYEAAKTAYNKAVAAQTTATNLSKLIRETEDGVDVGKSADGTTYAEGTSVTRQGTDGSFSILKVLSGVLTGVASFKEDVIELGKNSTSAVIRMCGGKASIGYNEDPQVQVYFTGSLTPASGAKPSLWPMVSVKDDVVTMRGSTIKVGALNSDKTDYSFTAAPMANLAQLLGDTGWQWIANYGGGDGIRWRYVGGTVYVQAAIHGEQTVGPGGWDAGTIPAAYRPSSTVAVAGVSFGALTNPTQLKTSAEGVINLWAPSNTSYFGGSLSYPLG